MKMKNRPAEQFPRPTVVRPWLSRLPAGTWLALLAAAVVLLLACQSGSSGEVVTETPEPESAPASTAAVAAPEEPADLAPNFMVTMLQGQDEVGGEQVEISQFLGSKPIVLNFWAGLCPPCRAEMPDFQAFYEKFNDRVLLLGVDVGQFTGLGSAEDARGLLTDIGVTYPAGSANDAAVMKDYRVLGMPSTVFIDARGEIFHNWTGALNEEVLEEKTLEMLSQ